MYRAQLHGREVMVNVSSDGAIWHHVLGRGQVILASSGDAYEWAKIHVAPEDFENVVRRLKPSTTIQHYMQSHLAG